jgi:hypothetical protein
MQEDIHLDIIGHNTENDSTTGVFRFDVALSFAGAQRDFARRLRNELRKQKLRVFFDEDFEHEMLGNDGQIYLRRIYGIESRTCAVLVSPEYDQRMWSQLERETIQSRELRGDTGALIPVLVDSYHPEWLPAGRIYYDASKKSLARLARILRRRLQYEVQWRAIASPGRLTSGSELDRYSLDCWHSFIHGFHDQAEYARRILPMRSSPSDGIAVYITQDANGVLYAHSNLCIGDKSEWKRATNESRDLRIIAKNILALVDSAVGAKSVTFLCDQRMIGAEGQLTLDGATDFVVRVVGEE